MAITWAELQEKFLVALDQVEDVLNRTVSVCEHFDSLIKEIESLKDEEAGLIASTQRNLEILESIGDVVDQDNIPPEILVRAAEIFVRVQYIIAVFVKINQMVETNAASTANENRPPTFIMPEVKGTIH